VTGGQGTVIGPRLEGGGVWLIENANLVLDTVNIEGNQAEYGAGVFAREGATITVNDSAVRDNDARLGLGSGGGFYLEANASLTMSNTTIRENSATIGCAGIELTAGGVVDGGGTSDITNNLGDNSGGGLCANFGAELVGLTINGNAAISGGALYGRDFVVRDTTIASNLGILSTGGVLTLGTNVFERVTFDANVGLVDVGAMSLVGGSADLIDCTLTGNTFSGNLGDVGGVEITGDGVLTSTNTDWGVNPPADIWLSGIGLPFTFSGVQSFVCDGATGTCQ
ncbi:MAG: hypothetical protein AAF211_26020, partial [Myxococcota bacterium]